MLDGLMRRAVFAQSDGVVREHIDDPLPHQRAQPQRRAQIVGKNQESRGVGNGPAVRRNAVADGAHGVFPHAEMQVAPAEIARPDMPGIVEDGQRGRRQIGGTAH